MTYCSRGNAFKSAIHNHSAGPAVGPGTAGLATLHARSAALRIWGRAALATSTHDLSFLPVVLLPGGKNKHTHTHTHLLGTLCGPATTVLWNAPVSQTHQDPAEGLGYKLKRPLPKASLPLPRLFLGL